MKVFIVGANFGNKGAQSMLFTTIGEIRRRCPEAEFIFAHSQNFPVLNDNFTFKEVFYNCKLIDVKADGSINFRYNNRTRFEETVAAIKNSDLVIDISGFALGNKWGAKSSFNYLNHIKLARSFNVPMILFPQSFGGFEFGDAQTFLDDEISSAMTYPAKIFARERDGFIPLRKKYGLQNVTLHPDLVLSGQNVNPAEIFKIPPKISVSKVLPESCVGIVPNLRSFDLADPWQTLRIFYETINFLLRQKKYVYLFRHSAEDILPCQWLKSLFANEKRVVLWENDFSCFEYDAVCRQFDFLIVGRFHGIVHAYKNNVPCILFGWAVKYRELAQLMYQSQYIFDITAPNVDIREIFSAIRDMADNVKLNKKILRERLAQVQRRSSCFDEAVKILNAGRLSQ
ncbi:MAG: polysaccharide pyruvyl transferase family protein [Selenomonadaceae bacterium]|nr:polysaccharide pyruvyl transferase family protein [Selenomonadaceae bacterium]